MGMTEVIRGFWVAVFVDSLLEQNRLYSVGVAIDIPIYVVASSYTFVSGYPVASGDPVASG
jgi:hypothetical protein